MDYEECVDLPISWEEELWNVSRKANQNREMAVQGSCIYAWKSATLKSDFLNSTFNPTLGDSLHSRDIDNILDKQNKQN